MVYGAKKVWRQLNREGAMVARGTVERLMRQMGLSGRVRGVFGDPYHRGITVAADGSARPADLVPRRFVADAPNQLWIADIDYVATWSGLAYTAFVTDVFSGTVEDVELATLGWVHWWNTRRLLEPIGYVPPIEFEQTWQQNHPSDRRRGAGMS